MGKQAAENHDLNINTIRTLSIDMVEKANSGHPGLPLGAAALAYIIWTKFLKHNPKDPKWPNRDRFVLSAGHGSALLYSLLHLTGYNLPISELKKFRQLGSKTPGHPEYGLTPGVEATTGPLGQGFANGVGMAISQKHLAALYNKKGFKLFDHHIYGLVSDGDLMEGVSAEAASLAGHLRLGNITYVYLDNKITIEGRTSITFTEDVKKRFEAYGWNVQIVNGYHIAGIESVLKKAKSNKSKPSLIIAHTHIGCGAPNKVDSPKVHGSPLGPDELKATKENIGWPTLEPFYVPSEAKKVFGQALISGKKLQADWQKMLEKYKKKYPKEYKEIRSFQTKKLPDLGKLLPKFEAHEKGIATRKASGEVINSLASKIPNLIGGSADLAPSTLTYMEGMGDFKSPNYKGRNFHFGIREHAMGSILNGIALSGHLIPYGATFLVFSDYMKPAIRLAALMEQQVVYVFTHDSIGLGEDGPTHQPVEHLVALRAIPGLNVIRPADANETAYAWKLALENKNSPSALILSRQGVPTLDRKKYGKTSLLEKGAYILSKSKKAKPQLIIMATGTEVSLALDAQEKLREQKIDASVISFPSWELFERQSKAYKESVLLKGVKKVAIEMGASLGWHKYTGSEGLIIGIDKFGASGPAKKVQKAYGFDADKIVNKIKAFMNAK